MSTHAVTGRALDRGEESRITEVGITGADETVAPRLGVEQGTPVHVRRRVVTREGVPVHMSSSFYTADVIAAVPELAEQVSTGGSRELAAERLGSPQDRVLEEVTSRLATDPEKDALGLRGPIVIVTQVVRTVYLEDGRIVEVAVKVVSGTTLQSWSTPLR
ncbi:UTRA domain-containing protein [Streptomyces sp. NPDC049879]|uniref:UTRA domain-containing protein n=1 Tax=Streptomyces sp. NPDC049879 TaxID=3365598 RepID=UPI00379CE0DB